MPANILNLPQYRLRKPTTITTPSKPAHAGFVVSKAKIKGIVTAEPVDVSSRLTSQARETGEELRGGHFNTHPHDRGGGALPPSQPAFTNIHNK